MGSGIAGLSPAARVGAVRAPKYIGAGMRRPLPALTSGAVRAPSLARPAWAHGPSYIGRNS